MSSIRVRFAPSPTGYLHVGGARTALFNFLFARRTHGVFILRIEDTDRERSSDEHVRGILDGMQWLGLNWDEGPYYQSAGFQRHHDAALSLVARGAAYHCFCVVREGDPDTPSLYDRRCARLSAAEVRSRLSRGEPACVRFKVPAGTTSWDDLIHGMTSFQNDQIEDLVLLRSDGSPTYNLSVVSDDLEMRVTHVVRGDDHISNTPKQILIYRALGSEPPRFGHLPLILGPDKKRLSKRHGAVSVLAYRELGIPACAMLNFLALCGWNPGDGSELMELDELIAKFDWDGVGKSSAVFDLDKLDWMSGKHIERIPLTELASMLGLDHEPRSLRFIELARARSRTLRELGAAVERYRSDEVHYDSDAIEKHLTGEDLRERLICVADALGAVEPWEAPQLEQAVRNAAGQRGVGAAKLIHPTRVALLGTAVSPGIFDLLAAIGRESSLKRLARLAERIGSGAVVRPASQA
jgi:glutamyl-tRNA synthetase